MLIFVAALAGDRGRLENYILHCDFKVWRFVAAHACHRAMRARKRKFRIGMVEPDDVRPRFGGVATLASQRRTIRPQPFHSLGKLSIVRIGVTACAGQILIAVRRWEVGSQRLLGFMAVGTGHRNMCPCEGESRLAMAAERKS